METPSTLDRTLLPPPAYPASASTMDPLERQMHLSYMREALEMAILALNTSETPVGCIMVHPTHGILGRGMNATNRTRNGTMHAEFVAINEILAAPKKLAPSILRECTLYVTVEPCIMCASLLRQLGVKKVFFGAVNEKFGGTGGVLDVHLRNGRKGREGGSGEGEQDEEQKEQGDYEVSGGWLREEAIVVLRKFYVQENERAPEPRNKKDRVLKLEVEPLVEGTMEGGNG